jgi:hypothetical protein
MNQMDHMISGAMDTQKMIEKSAMMETILMAMVAPQHARLKMSGSVWMTLEMIYGV